ncbi:hypothetical protein Fmac_026363 [Flemingia macrophylla]|uniref:Uncharacterized protein n=1 Tax=Flemingia macrophylla TaxID=520843 RepID=A0ABD1LEN7_9FABA
MVGHRSKKLKVEENCKVNISEKLVLSFEKLEEVQDELLKINEKHSDEVLKMEQKFNEMRKLVYDKRNEIIESVPSFWLHAFMGHPVLFEILNYEDQKGNISLHMQVAELIENDLWPNPLSYFGNEDDEEDSDDEVDDEPSSLAPPSPTAFPRVTSPYPALPRATSPNLAALAPPPPIAPRPRLFPLMRRARAFYPHPPHRRLLPHPALPRATSPNPAALAPPPPTAPHRASSPHGAELEPSTLAQPRSCLLPHRAAIAIAPPPSPASARILPSSSTSSSWRIFRCQCW